MSNCSPSRQSCTPSTVFAAVASPGCSQFFNPANFQAEQLIYDAAFNDLINSYGVPINYYVNTFNVLSADLFYGEHPIAPYLGPVSIISYIELIENPINLSRFGFASDDELTAYLHIDTFTTTFSAVINYAEFNQSIEPKSGDIIEVTALGCDRPNGRGAKWFEITERVDQDIATMNPLLGHYVYRLRAKRYEGSFEPGIIGEQGNNQIYDNSFSGILSSNIEIPSIEILDLQTESGDYLITQDGDPLILTGVTTPQLSSNPKTYPFDVDQYSKDNIFDNSVNDTSIYGTYY
jgi:hypothetical protein